MGKSLGCVGINIECKNISISADNGWGGGGGGGGRLILSTKQFKSRILKTFCCSISAGAKYETKFVRTKHGSFHQKHIENFKYAS